MNTPRHYLGAALLALAVVFAAWDGGTQGGKLVVTLALTAWGSVELEVFHERGDRR